MWTSCNSCQNGPLSLRLSHSKWLATRSTASRFRAAKPQERCRFIRMPCMGGTDERNVVGQAIRIEDLGKGLPNQGQSSVKGVDPGGAQSGVKEKEENDSPVDVDFLGELIAIQANDPKNIGFFGTRNMGLPHQQLVEFLSQALVLAGNHIYTSGALGTHAAVIRGALRAEKPELLTVVLPQSLSKQPEDSQILLKKVPNIEERHWNDELSLYDASKLCNNDILQHVQQVICFAFHDSRLMLETCQDAKEQGKIVTLFYLD